MTALALTSTSKDERACQMMMRKGDPGDSVAPRRTLFTERGTEVKIASLLEGMVELSLRTEEHL